MEKPIKLSKNFPYSGKLLKLKEILIKNGDEIRLVGGCVRDFLCKMKIKEFDFATKYTPKEVIELLNKEKIKVIPTGLKYGTVTAVMGDETFEITTLRSDKTCNGRHADVEFDRSYSKDAERRDFTINSMYLDFENNLYDYFNGREDLRNGLIRFIGNPEKRITEDYLRILRLFRFYCLYGNKIDPKSLEECARNKEKINKLSGERIKTELLKILDANSPVKTLNLMNKLGILKEIFRVEVCIEDLEKFLKVEQKLNIKKDSIFRLGLLLRRRNKENIKSIAEKLKLSNTERKKLIFYNNPIHVDCQTSEKEIKEILIDYNKRQVLDSLLLSFLNYGGNLDLKIKDFKKLHNFIKKCTIPKIPVNGDDLIEAGISEGEKIGLFLKKAKNFWIKSDYKAGKEEIINNILYQNINI